MSVIKKLDKDPVVAFHVAYAKLPGSDPICALFLSQVAYWCGKSDDGVAWITHQAMYDQTGISRKQQDRAAEYWSSVGVMEKFIKGIPPKIHYFIDYERLEKFILDAPEENNDMSERDKLGVPKGHHVMSERDKTSIIDSIDSKRLFTVAALPTCVHSQQSENTAGEQSAAPTQTLASSQISSAQPQIEALATRPASKQRPAPADSVAASIYALYPRKVARAAALKAIKKALVENPDIDMSEAVTEYAKATSTWKESDKTYIPYPASWFNGGCFLDDRNEWWKKSKTSPVISRGRRI